MDKRASLERAYSQLAIEFNTTPEDIRAGGVIFTLPALNPGRRAYDDGSKLPFFEMVTTGRATVIMAEERLHPELQAWAKDADEPHWLFEFPRMLKLAELLLPYGCELSQTFHHYMPAGSFPAAKAPEGLSLRWIEREEIRDFYPNNEWPNALQDKENPRRPDVLALAAADGEKIVAMAGASIDAVGIGAPDLWQIGIDVCPEYRGRGLGVGLVTGLAAEIEDRGAVPFYGTSLSNIHSQNISRRAGFFPAWVAVSGKMKR